MLIRVRVITNARRPEVIEQPDGYRVRIDATAQKDRANERLAEILAEHFRVPQSSVRIVKGQKSRDKIIDLIPIR